MRTLACLLVAAVLQIQVRATTINMCDAGKPTLQRWKEDFAGGDRGFFVSVSNCRNYATCQGDKNQHYGAKYMTQCAAKSGGIGSSGIRDPATTFDQAYHNFEFYSRNPCRFSGDVFQRSPWRNANAVTQNCSSTVSSPTAAPTPTPTPTPSPAVAYATCSYPPEPTHHTHHPERPWSGQFQIESWLGPVFQISTVNGEETNCNQGALPHNNLNSGNVPAPAAAAAIKFCEDQKATDSYTVESLFGVPNTSVCQVGVQEEDPTLFFDGGIMITHTRGSYLTTRSFMFKNDAQRALAMNDARNLGLPYAKQFAGANGCDVEVVMEIQPQTLGGFTLDFSVPMIAHSIENERALRDSILVYNLTSTGDIVVAVPEAALRTAQNLPMPNSCGGNREIIRFASSFVCKTTGAHVTGNILFHNVDGQHVAISSDPANPTPWQTNPPRTWPKGSTEYLHSSASFSISVPSANAPTSCGSFYWDPVIQSVNGDGFGYDVEAPTTKTTTTTTMVKTPTTTTQGQSPTGQQQTIVQSVKMGNLDMFTNAAHLITLYKNSLASSSGTQNADIMVEIDAIVVKLVASFNPAVSNLAHITEAVAERASVGPNSVAIESSRRLGDSEKEGKSADERRLAQNVNVDVNVPSNTDVVLKVRVIHTAMQDNTALASVVTAKSGTTVAASTDVKVAVTMRAVVQSSATLIAVAIDNAVGTALGGNVTSSSIDTGLSTTRPSNTDDTDAEASKHISFALACVLSALFSQLAY